MKRVGNYCRVQDDFDIDHEINSEVNKVKEQLKDINFDNYQSDAIKIKKAMIETILESI